MVHSSAWTWMFAAVCMVAGHAKAESVTGSFVAAEEPSLALSLTESLGGDISGRLTEPGTSMPIEARREGARIVGMVGPTGTAQPFTAVIQSGQLLMDIGPPDESYRLTFHRSGETARAEGATDTPTGAAESAGQRAASAAARAVVINGQRLTDSELEQLERAYGIRIDDADYWYDPVLGAWGVRGGPTMGFIVAGLALGGPLRADASGGNTQVFVNGREIHVFDLMALQQITGPIMPGRYFINSQGLAGFEGGPPLWNLLAMAAQAQQSSGGGSNTWQSKLTGASGFSDGHSGAVFLPNGGIVSVGD